MARRAALALAVAVPCALLGACGGDDEEVVVATPEAMLAAGQATLDAGSATVELAVTVDLAGLGLPLGEGPIDLTGEGVIDFAGRRSQLDIDLSALAGEGGGELGQGLGALFEEPLRTVQDGTTTYACAAFFQLIAGGECVSIDLSEQAAGDGPAGFLGQAGIDGSSLLQALSGVVEVEEVGEEEVVGVSTTHLAGTFTIAEAVANLPDDAAEQLRAAFESAGIGEAGLDAENAFDVWIDDDGLVRQVRTTLDVGALAGVEGNEPAVIEFRFLELDVPVEIEVPTDAVDIGELEGLLGSFGGG